MNKHVRPEEPHIDYTLLDPRAPLGDYAELAKTARAHDSVRAVCVPPVPQIVRVCEEQLRGSDKGICVVIDFPFGNGGLHFKKEQVVSMLEVGAREFDIVISLPALRAGKLKEMQEEMRILRVMDQGLYIKAIMETGHSWYNEMLIKIVARTLHDAGAQCLKTSTGKKNIDTPSGYLPAVSLEDKIRHAVWMHEAAPDLMIKVAGGIANLQDVRDICAEIPKEKVLIGTSQPIWLHREPD